MNLPHGLGRYGQVCVRRYGIDTKTGRLLNEYKIVAQSIKNRHTTNTNWSDTLVLSHTHMSINKLTDELDNSKIRWQDYGLSGFDATDTAAVVVSTIHSAKGAEASNVYVIGCQAPAINGTPETRENQRRLMYVAITRAKHRVELSCTIDPKKDLRPSFEFEKIEAFGSDESEEEEELEYDERNDLSNLKYGQRFNVLWDDSNIYPVFVQRVEAHYVTILWTDSKSSETTRVKKRDFARMVRRATDLTQ